MCADGWGVAAVRHARAGSARAGKQPPYLGKQCVPIAPYMTTTVQSL